MRLVIAGGKVVNAFGSQVADVVVEEGRITGIVSPRRIAGDVDVVVDAKDCLVVPGGVDPHVHFDSPTQKAIVADDFYSGTLAAAFGGTTTVIDFVFQLGDSTISDALAGGMRRAKGKAIVDYGFHAVITNSDEKTLAELPEVLANGVSSCKLYMAYESRGLFMRDDNIFKVMRAAGKHGILVMLHAENGPLTQLFVQEALLRGDTGPQWHPKTRPPLTEVEAIYRGISIAELAGVPVYFVHVSTNGGASHIRDARMRGMAVYGETCPHYLLLDESVYDAAGFEAAKWVLTPPIRDLSNQSALWKFLKSRDLSTVATDHCPFCFEGGKDIGISDFSRIPNGGPGVEHRLSLLFDAGVTTGKISVERWVELTSTAPARLFGLSHAKGHISVGADADLVIFDPNMVSEITSATSHSAVDYSMYEGRKLTGGVRSVISRGEVIVDQGTCNATPGRGRYVPRLAHEPLP